MNLLDFVILAANYGATAPATTTEETTTERTIKFSGTTITTTGTGTTVSGNKVTITSGGEYTLTGTLSDGQLIVNVTDEDDVILNLSGITMNCSSSAPIYAINANKLKLVLTDSTVNYVTDGANYSTTDGPEAAIYSKDDLTIKGTGTLKVTGNYKDAIKTTNEFKLNGGVVVVNSVDDGIIGKDNVEIS